MWLYGDGGCGIQYVIAKDTECRIIIIARHFVTVECGFAVTVMRITLYVLYTVRQLETRAVAVGQLPAPGPWCCRSGESASRVWKERTPTRKNSHPLLDSIYIYSPHVSEEPISFSTTIRLRVPF